MRTLAAVALLVPALALAQEAAPQLQEDPRAARFKDVERGFFFGFEAGYLGLLDTPTADRDQFRLAGKSGGRAGGAIVGALLGVDLGSRFSVALFAQGGNQGAGNANYGAFSLLSFGADAKVALRGWRDRNDWERTFVYVHGRAGYAKTYPEGLFDADVVVQGGPGIEYFTKLRHFSIGAAADVVYARKNAVFGFAVYPTVRYTF